ncbi:hypothetical protein [Pseudomonas migulae]|uniref:ParB/Sulfiredoxin domain-containing protein n=1 Tax=Pseudomonas migulae TaxID=78543 RepID=A0ABY8ML53_9PSED|nr:hypothetical protein [Pseudomonas migulae]WGK88070.1 hypothetical protein MOQ58_16125 [Pseudomonas migulae]
MSSRKTISINSILLDSENARHGEKQSQLDIYKWMTSGAVAQKVIKLATDVAAKGLSPFDNMGVMPSKESDKEPWIVVEGNRRVAALKFLNNPKLCPDLKLRKQYEQLKKKATAQIPLRVEFAVFKDFSEGSYWIQLRHGGEHGGVGISSWGTKEYDSFLARMGARSTNRSAVNLLSYALSKELITPAQYDQIATTTLYRMLSTPAVRKVLGCHVSKGEVFRIADEKYFDRAVATMLIAMASGEVSVTKLKSKEQREDFAKDMNTDGGWGDYHEQSPQPISAEPNDTASTEADYDSPDESGEGGDHTKTGSPAKPRSGARDRLFAVKSHGLDVPASETKVNDILRELATLKHSGTKGTPISVSFLLRALLELSSDNYLANNPGIIRRAETNTPLREKVKYSARHMHANGKISQDNLDVVTRHCAEDGGMLTISTLQKYLHSTAHFPNGESLNSMWSELKYYIIECW